MTMPASAWQLAMSPALTVHRSGEGYVDSGFRRETQAPSDSNLVFLQNIPESQRIPCSEILKL